MGAWNPWCEKQFGPWVSHSHLLLLSLILFILWKKITATADVTDTVYWNSTDYNTLNNRYLSTPLWYCLLTNMLFFDRVSCWYLSRWGRPSQLQGMSSWFLLLCELHHIYWQCLSKRLLLPCRDTQATPPTLWTRHLQSQSPREFLSRLSTLWCGLLLC